MRRVHSDAGRRTRWRECADDVNVSSGADGGRICRLRRQAALAERCSVNPRPALQPARQRRPLALWRYHHRVRGRTTRAYAAKRPLLLCFFDAPSAAGDGTPPGEGQTAHCLGGGGSLNGEGMSTSVRSEGAAGNLKACASPLFRRGCAAEPPAERDERTLGTEIAPPMRSGVGTTSAADLPPERAALP
mmetsp:Transcript_45792/g.97677  ORF Transcript_45792/g.97677 Transcript_45792/m.97677 type:complete len:189 (+) Transcript_45792:455-1021(+)